MDTETGLIEITDHFGGSDAGTIMNPRAAYNQMTSFFAGLDVAIREETVWDKWDNKVLNPNLIEYKARTFNEAPPHDHVCLESTKGRESDFPFGAMGSGNPSYRRPGRPSPWLSIMPAALNWRNTHTCLQKYLQR